MNYICGIITQPEFHLHKIIFYVRTSMQHIGYLMTTFPKFLCKSGVNS